jgi:predicted AlkP superfamily phosphohydrolase/phosphomutase
MTPQLLFPWARTGLLPNIADLLASGPHGLLRSTLHPQSPQAWSTIYTGCNPGGHGIFGFTRFVRGQGAPRFVSAADRRAPPFWELPQLADLSMGLINLPFTYPVSRVNGYLFAGIGVPGRRGPFAWPPELRDTRSLIGAPYPITGADVLTSSGREYLESLQRLDELRLALARRMLRERPTDVLFVVFESTDRVQHAFWAEMDPLFPGRPEPAWPAAREAIRETYRLVDRLVGELVSLAPAETAVVLLSDHGAGPCHGTFNLARWLVDHGYLVLRSRGAGRPGSGALLPALTRLRRRVSGRWISRLPQSLRRAWRARLYPSESVDWERSRAVPFESFGSIYLLEDEPRARRRLAEEIRAGLLELEEPGGGPLLKAVRLKEEIYAGAATGDAPDLILEWRSYRYNAEPPAGTVPRELFIPPRAWEWTELTYSGFHRREGIIACRLPEGEGEARRIGGRLEDIVPTICRILERPAPAGAEGRSLFGPVSRSTAKVRASTTEALSPEEESALEEHLRNLGYF